MAHVKMYTTTYCGFCRAAKTYLASKGVANVEEIDVTNDPETRAWLLNTTGQRTVPQIFVGETHIGGFTDMRDLDQQGKLEPLLAQG